MSKLTNEQIEQLEEAIKDASVTIKIKVPSQDYYARPGDADTESLTYISPYKLLEALNLLK